MLVELSADNQALTRYFRAAHETCHKYNDVATASEIEVGVPYITAWASLMTVAQIQAGEILTTPHPSKEMPVLRLASKIVGESQPRAR
jgi:hypothetical protein